jgi:hypothetical protein
MPDNAAKYSPEHLAAIKSKIRSAGKKYGITFAEDVQAAAMTDIELARPGSWKLASGPLEVTDEMLADAARFANREGARPGYLKIGHTDTRFMAGDGEPALGWLYNVRLEEDDQGPVLKGDLDDVPDWLATAIPKHWPDRSIEGWADYVHDGQKYGLVVNGLALLGVAPPGMSSIQSLRDLPAAVGVAAAEEPENEGAIRIIASFGAPKDPASEAEKHTKKGAGMTLAKYREALDELSDDASEEEARAALVAAGLVLTPPEGTPVAASAVPAGMRVVADTIWDENQKTIKTLSAFVEKTKRDERDEVIAKAIQAGKFTPAQRKQISDQWDAAPDATRKFIEIMTPNHALAVMASGYAGGVEGDEDADYSALFGTPEARKAG